MSGAARRRSLKRRRRPAAAPAMPWGPGALLFGVALLDAIVTGMPGRSTRPPASRAPSESFAEVVDDTPSVPKETER